MCVNTGKPVRDRPGHSARVLTPKMWKYLLQGCSFFFFKCWIMQNLWNSHFAWKHRCVPSTPWDTYIILAALLSGFLKNWFSVHIHTQRFITLYLFMSTMLVLLWVVEYFTSDVFMRQTISPSPINTLPLNNTELCLFRLPFEQIWGIQNKMEVSCFFLFWSESTDCFTHLFLEMNNWRIPQKKNRT